MSEIARHAGISRQTLYAALGDGGNPTLSTFLGVLKALGIALRAEAGVQEASEQQEPEPAAGYA